MRQALVDTAASGLKAAVFGSPDDEVDPVCDSVCLDDVVKTVRDIRVVQTFDGAWAQVSSLKWLF